MMRMRDSSLRPALSLLTAIALLVLAGEAPARIRKASRFRQMERSSRWESAALRRVII